MPRMREVLADAEEKLRQAGIEEYKNDAWLLFEYVFQIDRTHYFLQMNEEIGAEEKMRYEQYKNVVDRRCCRIPLQHIIGNQIFMGIDFEVNEHVLIPRQDTEILVEQALTICNDSNKDYMEILDMCTGSGCIAISMKMLAKKQITVTAADISEQALQVAERNAKKNHCEIVFVHSDLFEKLKDKTFDMIISNPPYIRSSVISSLMKEVRLYEPMLALDGDEDGLKFYREITMEAEKYLNPGGCILYEIGYDQAEEVSRILEQRGFSSVHTVKDLAGLDRVVMAEKQ